MSQYYFDQLVSEALQRSESEVRRLAPDTDAKELPLVAARVLGDLLGPLREAVAQRVAREHGGGSVDEVKRLMVEKVLSVAFPLKPVELISSTLNRLLLDGHVDDLCDAVGALDPEMGTVAIQRLADRLIETFGGLAGKVQAHVVENGWVGLAQEIPKGRTGGEVWCDLAGELAWRHRVIKRGKGELELAEALPVPLPIFVRELKRVAAEVPCPPLTSAHNIETATMGWAHLVGSLGKLGVGPELLVSVMATRPELAKVARTFAELTRIVAPEPARDFFVKFSLAWRKCGYAKLEVSHKLAANLCLTDVPSGMTINSPWKAWSLVVPDGLLGAVARLWVYDDGAGLVEVRAIDTKGGPMPLEVLQSMEGMCRSLALGAALALSNPDDFQKRSSSSGGAPGSARRRHGEPDFCQARFLLSAPVKIDLREHVREICEGVGRKGSSPKVQFIVRGHWRQQACGPEHSLRKPIWIQAFWKGPEESRILLRRSQVVGDTDEAAKKSKKKGRG
jgi:hypothetical protein